MSRGTHVTHDHTACTHPVDENAVKLCEFMSRADSLTEAKRLAKKLVDDHGSVIAIEAMMMALHELGAGYAEASDRVAWAIDVLPAADRARS
jgi:hypothetical protein